MKGLYEKVTGRDNQLRRDPYWEDMLNTTTHRLLLHRLVWAVATQAKSCSPVLGAVEGLRALLLVP